MLLAVTVPRYIDSLTVLHSKMFSLVFFPEATFPLKISVEKAQEKIVSLSEALFGRFEFLPLRKLFSSQNGYQLLAKWRRKKAEFFMTNSSKHSAFPFFRA